MKKRWMLILCAVVFPICLAAQQTEYNRKGDEAMQRRDYSDARLFYGEGIPYCDIYSIRQLTAIWRENEDMQRSMHGLMSRCFNCLSVKATDNDTTAISMLILYYSEGIGTPKNDELSAYWTTRKEELREADPMERYVRQIERSKENVPPKTDFFAGYSYSVFAPFGVTVGAVRGSLGGYIRARGNLSFQSSDLDFNGERPATSDFLEGEEKKTNALAITAGLVIRAFPKFYTSFGLGYGKRDVLYRYSRKDDSGAEVEKLWYKSSDYSYNGITVEADVMYVFHWLYVSAGCNTLNFKTADINAGIGVFF